MMSFSSSSSSSSDFGIKSELLDRPLHILGAPINVDNKVNEIIATRRFVSLLTSTGRYPDPLKISYNQPHHHYYLRGLSFLDDDPNPEIEPKNSENESETLENDLKISEIDQETLEIDEKTLEIDQKTSEIDQETSEIDQETLEIDEKTLEIDQKPPEIDENMRAFPCFLNNSEDSDKHHHHQASINEEKMEKESGEIKSKRTWKRKISRKQFRHHDIKIFTPKEYRISSFLKRSENKQQQQPTSVVSEPHREAMPMPLSKESITEEIVNRLSGNGSRIDTDREETNNNNRDVSNNNNIGKYHHLPATVLPTIQKQKLIKNSTTDNADMPSLLQIDLPSNKSIQPPEEPKNEPQIVPLEEPVQIPDLEMVLEQSPTEEPLEIHIPEMVPEEPQEIHIPELEMVLEEPEFVPDENPPSSKRRRSSLINNPIDLSQKNTKIDLKPLAQSLIDKYIPKVPQKNDQLTQKKLDHIRNQCDCLYKFIKEPYQDNIDELIRISTIYKELEHLLENDELPEEYKQNLTQILSQTLKFIDGNLKNLDSNINSSKVIHFLGEPELKSARAIVATVLNVIVNKKHINSDPVDSISINSLIHRDLIRMLDQLGPILATLPPPSRRPTNQTAEKPREAPPSHHPTNQAAANLHDALPRYHPTNQPTEKPPSSHHLTNQTAEQPREAPPPYHMTNQAAEKLREAQIQAAEKPRSKVHKENAEKQMQQLWRSFVSSPPPFLVNDNGDDSSKNVPHTQTTSELNVPQLPLQDVPQLSQISLPSQVPHTQTSSEMVQKSNVPHLPPQMPKLSATLPQNVPNPLLMNNFPPLVNQTLAHQRPQNQSMNNFPQLLVNETLAHQKSLPQNQLINQTLAHQPQNSLLMNNLPQLVNQLPQNGSMVVENQPQKPLPNARNQAKKVTKPRAPRAPRNPPAKKGKQTSTQQEPFCCNNHEQLSQMLENQRIYQNMFNIQTNQEPTYFHNNASQKNIPKTSQMKPTLPVLPTTNFPQITINPINNQQDQRIFNNNLPNEYAMRALSRDNHMNPLISPAQTQMPLISPAIGLQNNRSQMTQIQMNPLISSVAHGPRVSRDISLMTQMSPLIGSQSRDNQIINPLISPIHKNGDNPLSSLISLTTHGPQNNRLPRDINLMAQMNPSISSAAHRPQNGVSRDSSSSHMNPHLISPIIHGPQNAASRDMVQMSPLMSTAHGLQNAATSRDISLMSQMQMISPVSRDSSLTRAPQSRDNSHVSPLISPQIRMPLPETLQSRLPEGQNPIMPNNHYPQQSSFDNMFQFGNLRPPLLENTSFFHNLRPTETILAQALQTNIRKTPENVAEVVQSLTDVRKTPENVDQSGSALEAVFRKKRKGSYPIRIEKRRVEDIVMGDSSMEVSEAPSNDENNGTQLDSSSDQPSVTLTKNPDNQSSIKEEEIDQENSEFLSWLKKINTNAKLKEKFLEVMGLPKKPVPELIEISDSDDDNNDEVKTPIIKIEADKSPKSVPYSPEIEPISPVMNNSFIFPLISAIKHTINCDNIEELIPNGKLRYMPEKHAFLRYHDYAQAEMFLKSLESDREVLTQADVSAIKKAYKNTDLKKSEMYVLPEHVQFTEMECLEDVEKYISERKLVDIYVPSDFAKFYAYVTGFQIYNKNPPISLRTFLTMYNTNRLMELMRKYLIEKGSTG